MAARKVEAASPKIGIEPPGLELDLGYSILEARPSVKFKLSFGPLTRKADRDRFSVTLREWWVRWRGARDGKRALVDPAGQTPTSFEEKILRERRTKIGDLRTETEREFGIARKQIEELMPPEFDAATTAKRLSNQAEHWIELYREALAQASRNETDASADHEKTRQALEAFVEKNALAAKKPLARKTAWERMSALAVLVFVEALISLPPIAERKGGGQLLLSFLYPVTVSIANAIIGLLVGLLGVHTLLYARSLVERAIAGVCVAFALVLVAWMNLAVARWREGNELPLGANGFLPASALSIVLLVIGLGVFAFAVYKGVRDFSPGFPGHEEKWDQHMEDSLSFHYWKDRYLHLLHSMRRSSAGRYDQVRRDVALIRGAHEARKVIANQAIVDLQTAEKLLPELCERVDASARTLLKAYRESACVAVRRAGEKTLPSLAHPPLPEVDCRHDVAAVRAQVERLAAVVDRNLGEIGKFEALIEDKAKEVNVNIDALSRAVRGQQAYAA